MKKPHRLGPFIPVQSSRAIARIRAIARVRAAARVPAIAGGIIRPFRGKEEIALYPLKINTTIYRGYITANISHYWNLSRLTFGKKYLNSNKFLTSY
jgi:hypothetical protein